MEPPKNGGFKQFPWVNSKLAISSGHLWTIWNPGLARFHFFRSGKRFFAVEINIAMIYVLLILSYIYI